MWSLYSRTASCWEIWRRWRSFYSSWSFIMRSSYSSWATIDWRCWPLPSLLVNWAFRSSICCSKEWISCSFELIWFSLSILITLHFSSAYASFSLSILSNSLILALNWFSLPMYSWHSRSNRLIASLSLVTSSSLALCSCISCLSSSPIAFCKVLLSLLFLYADSRLYSNLRMVSWSSAILSWYDPLNSLIYSWWETLNLSY